MQPFAVVLLNPPGFAHAGALREVAENMRHSLAAQGPDCIFLENTFAGDRLNLVFAGHLLPCFEGWDAHGSDHIVLFNLEQIRDSLFEQAPHYLALLRRCRVWDYDARNAAALAHLGVSRIDHVRIGYAEVLTRISPARTQDIDVLFYGSPTPRRLALRDELGRRKLATHFAFGVYGPERDALIARAKVMVNPGTFGSGGIFDMVRLSYLLANRKAVVMESGIDAAQEREFDDGVAFAPYAELAAECSYLCAVEAERHALEMRGFELFSGMPQGRYLAPVLARLGQ